VEETKQNAPQNLVQNLYQDDEDGDGENAETQDEASASPSRHHAREDKHIKRLSTSVTARLDSLLAAFLAEDETSTSNNSYGEVDTKHVATSISLIHSSQEDKKEMITMEQERKVSEPESSPQEHPNPTTTPLDPILEAKKLARATRLAKVKERIRLEQMKKEKAIQEKAEASEGQSDSERRFNLSLQWYTRCGRPSKDDFTQRVRTMIQTDGYCDISVADIERLPWTTNGSRVNC
jgi:hypothetical protein